MEPQPSLIDPSEVPVAPRSSGRHAGRRPGPRPDWYLDARTREIGRKGVAAARQALRHATPQEAA